MISPEMPKTWQIRLWSYEYILLELNGIHISCRGIWADSAWLQYLRDAVSYVFRRTPGRGRPLIIVYICIGSSNSVLRRELTSTNRVQRRFSGDFVIGRCWLRYRKNGCARASRWWTGSGTDHRERTGNSTSRTKSGTTSWHDCLSLSIEDYPCNQCICFFLLTLKQN